MLKKAYNTYYPVRLTAFIAKCPCPREIFTYFFTLCFIPKKVFRLTVRPGKTNPGAITEKFHQSRDPDIIITTREMFGGKKKIKNVYRFDRVNRGGFFSRKFIYRFCPGAENET